MKTIAIVICTALFTLLCVNVWNSTKAPDCERLFDEYTNAVNMDLRSALMTKGVNNGCFHAE